MKKIAKKHLLKIKPYVPGKPIEEVKRELGLRQVIKLASNENPFGPSKKVLSAIDKAARNVNRYPESGCFYLRKALSKKLKVKPEQIIFGNGSDEIIVLAVRAFVGKKDEVIVSDPSFLIYRIAAQVAGAKIKQIPLNDFRYDIDKIKRAVTKKTKIIFMGNPDNPGGQYASKKEMSELLKDIRKDVLIFIDEAYYEYVQEADYADSVGLIKKYNNIIVTRTFSKMYGLAGLRIGYGLADEETIDILDRIREPFNVNSIAQAAALACLNDSAYYKNIAKRIKVQREYLLGQLSELGLPYLKSCTNFIIVNVPADSTDVVEGLLRKGVITRDMKFWGMNKSIRITIGSEEENKKLIKTLREIL